MTGEGVHCISSSGGITCLISVTSLSLSLCFLIYVFVQHLALIPEDKQHGNLLDCFQILCLKSDLGHCLGIHSQVYSLLIILSLFFHNQTLCLHKAFKYYYSSENLVRVS